MVYQDNVAQSTAALQDNFGPLSDLVLQTPPDSPFCHVLVEVALDNLVHAARQELYQEEEESLHAHIKELEPEHQYPDPFDVSPQAPLQYQVSDPNDDIPKQELLPPVVVAPVATVPSPAPPSRSVSPVFIKQETPEPPTLVFSPAVGVPVPPPPVIKPIPFVSSTSPLALIRNIVTHTNTLSCIKEKIASGVPRRSS